MYVAVVDKLTCDAGLAMDRSGVFQNGVGWTAQVDVTENVAMIGNMVGAVSNVIIARRQAQADICRANRAGVHQCVVSTRTDINIFGGR